MSKGLPRCVTRARLRASVACRNQTTPSFYEIRHEIAAKPNIRDFAGHFNDS